MTNLTDVTIHVDPACPWAWLTSRWLAEAEKVRPLRVTTRLFVLAEINRESEPDERHLRFHRASETALRVMVAARRAGGDPALARLFTELGEAHHERGEQLDDPRGLRHALVAAGLDPGLAVSALADPTTRDELLAEHRADRRPRRLRGAHPGAGRRPADLRAGGRRPDHRGGRR